MGVWPRSIMGYWTSSGKDWELEEKRRKRRLRRRAIKCDMNRRGTPGKVPYSMKRDS